MIRRGSVMVVICACAALLAPACSSSQHEKIDEHRSPLNSEIGAQLFDKQVREFWSLGMTRDEVRSGGTEARVRLTSTQDARSLREIDPSYDDRPALVARIIQPGLSIDSKYFEASNKVGYLYFFFDAADHLRLVSYRLTKEQEQQDKQTVRVILPEEPRP